MATDGSRSLAYALGNSDDSGPGTISSRIASAPLQPFERSRLRRQARGDRRAVPRSAGAQLGAVARWRRARSRRSTAPSRGLPLKPGKAGTMTHDYKRHGTTTLFAALNVLDGTVVGRCMARHRHQEFLRFLNAIERAVPAGKVIHVILDNYAAHKHPKVLAGSPGTRAGPSTSPDLRLLAQCGRDILSRRSPAGGLKRSAFRSIVELQAAHQPLPRRAQPRPPALRSGPNARLNRSSPSPMT